MFITQAFADTVAAAPADQQGSILLSLAPLLVIFVFFYLLVIRPQSKKIAAHQGLLNTLKTGDKVVTMGGIYGTVVRVQDHDVMLEIATGVQVKVQKQTVTMLQEITPANDTKKK